MGARWPVLPSLTFHRVQTGCKQWGVSLGSQRHQRTGRLCPFHPGPGSEGEAISWPLPTNKSEGCRAQEPSPRLSVGRCGCNSWALKGPPPAACSPKGSARMEWTPVLDGNKTSEKTLFRCDREHALKGQSGGIITEWNKRSKIISTKP